MTQSLDPEGAAAAIEYCYEQGWSDGLPVVPPAPGLVERFLACTRRDRKEVIWRMEQVGRSCTVELAAVNAAMAGCRPEYFPVVLAALEAAVDEGSPRAGLWQSTTGGAPLIIVNGPARGELGFNSKGNVFGPGFRANATVGRAIRLIIMNVYGIRPHGLDQSSQGNPGKYSLCLAENEEDSPWEPLHVELGYARETSVVSALNIRSCDFLDNRQSADPVHILNDVVDTVTRTGAMFFRAGRTACVVLGPEHARLLAKKGYSKADVKEFIAANSVRSYADLRKAGKDGVEEPVGFARPAGEAEARGRENELVRIVPSAQEVMVVVAGAPNAGVSTIVQTFGTHGHRFPGRAVVEAAS